MIRKLLLGLSILALVAAPLPAWARAEQNHEFHGRREFPGHERFERRRFHRPFVVSPFIGAYASPYVYGSFCSWQPGYWTEQTYSDVYGNSTTVPQWVPPQYVCS
jgi:hypothetical protein